MVTRLKENDLYNVDRRVWMVRVLTTVLTETEKVPAWTLDKFEPCLLYTSPSPRD